MESLLELFTEEPPTTYKDYKEGMFIIYWNDTGHFYISSSKNIYAAYTSQKSLLINDRHTNVSLQDKYNENKDFIIKCLFTSNKTRVVDIGRFYRDHPLSFNLIPIFSRIRPAVLPSLPKPEQGERISLRQTRPTINEGIIYNSVKELSVFLNLSNSGTIRRLASKRHPDCNYLDLVQV